MIALPEQTVGMAGDLSDAHYAFIFAMGFEDRALAIPAIAAQSALNRQTISIKYIQPKGSNKEQDAHHLFQDGDIRCTTIPYSVKKAHEFEHKLRALCRRQLKDITGVVVDVSAMSKFLILVTVLVLLNEKKSIRIVCATATDYAPTKAEYDDILSKSGDQLTAFAGQPSAGVSEILRSACMSSTRMQGQPVCAVAFTSFNEELIRHCVGSLNPHRLILLNGIPPSPLLKWRAFATQHIHKKLIDEYADENPISEQTGLLVRSVSTFDYRETVQELLGIRQRFSTYERLIYFATGSKMQTVALALLKAAFDDVHIEYPIPDSYFFQKYSKGIGELTSVPIDNSMIESIRAIASC